MIVNFIVPLSEITLQRFMLLAQTNLTYQIDYVFSLQLVQNVRPSLYYFYLDLLLEGKEFFPYTKLVLGEIYFF